MMCAIEAGRRGRRVVLLEHAERTGKKILISGGGRCNFTNIHTTAENFLSDNPHFAKSALARFTPADIIAMIERHGIRYHEKTLGQLFCDRSALDVVNMLEHECAEARVTLITGTRILSVVRDGRFRVQTPQVTFDAGAVVVATGGLSIPKMGATGLAYDLARQFGLKLISPRPALVPLLLAEAEKSWTELAGVSADVTAQANRGPTFREKLLVTHRGLSGPAVLQASSYWRPGEAIQVDFAPQVNGQRHLLASLLEHGARRDAVAFKQALRDVLPQRLAAQLAELGAPEGWSNAALEAAERRVRGWEFRPSGTEGFEKAEVTAGGVDTAGLNSKTMEARAVPGIYFIGEGVDVTGHLGGFNFQWAWASAVAAGSSV
jgi:hypothetical protein